VKKQDWKNLTIFLIFLLAIAPLIYLIALQLFSYENNAPKTRCFINIGQNKNILTGVFEPCPVIPTCLCEKKSLLVPISSSSNFL